MSRGLGKTSWVSDGSGGLGRTPWVSDGSGGLGKTSQVSDGSGGWVRHHGSWSPMGVGGAGQDRHHRSLDCSKGTESDIFGLMMVVVGSWVKDITASLVSDGSGELGTK